LQGPTPIIDEENFEKIDLKELLVFSKESAKTDKSTNPKTDLAKLKEQVETMSLAQAFAVFDSNINGIGDSAGILRARNRVQDRIIAASNQRCGSYVRFLKQYDSEANLLLGTLTTVAAGLGSIFTGASTARALSGSAAIFSGIRGENNEAFFQSLTVQVLSNGIKLNRKEILDNIEKKRRVNLTEYTTEMAVADAVNYHSACSVVRRA